MPLSPAAPPVRPTCKTCGVGRAGIDRSQQVTATPGRLQRVGSRLPWHSSPCWGHPLSMFILFPLLHSILSGSIINPSSTKASQLKPRAFPISHFPFCISLSPGRRRPSDSVGRGRISGALEPLLPIRTGQQGGNTAQKYERRQSDTATRRPSVSPPTTSENPLETLARHRPPAKPTPQNRARKDRTLLPRPAIPLVSPRLVDTAIEHR